MAITEACRGEDPELFFPIATEGPALLQISAARAVCRRCAVAAMCLAYALQTRQAGIWGRNHPGATPRHDGTTPLARRRAERPPDRLGMPGPAGPARGGAGRRDTRSTGCAGEGAAHASNGPRSLPAASGRPAAVAARGTAGIDALRVRIPNLAAGRRPEPGHRSTPVARLHQTGRRVTPRTRIWT